MHTQPTPADAIPSVPPALMTLPAPAAEPSPAVLLFGRDERGRPHASRFLGDEAAEAKNAARLMGLRLAHADTDALRDLAARLPAGRLFPSGRGFVPFVKAEFYERLLAATGTPDTPLPVRAAGKAAEAPPPAGAGSGGKGSPDAPGEAAKPPGDWASIGIGSVVLARGDEEDDGYYAATVIATKADDHFVLRWRDYPDLLEFSRHRHALGLLHPGAATKGL